MAQMANNFFVKKLKKLLAKWATVHTGLKNT